MKNFTLLAALLLFAVCSYAQKITRGSDVGEIYFLGPTHTGTGLYYSTDFGETAVCVDSTLNAISISADKTKGGIYCQELPVNLYYSQDFGNQDTWVFKQGDISDDISSGVNEGYIFNHIASHSEDYGSDFISHAANGFFGSLKASEIDNQIGIGYAVTKSSTIPDSVFLLITYDNFENLSIINAIHEDTNIFKHLTRGNSAGELFTIRYRPFTFSPYEIYFCDDFGSKFTKMNELNMYNYYSFGVEGGREDGELFLVYNFVNLMWQNAHTYIYHSVDYGVTFNVYHPFSKGNEPMLANFSTTDQEVHLTTQVEFCNYSIGEVLEYQWDFENDGIVDSFEESPNWIYYDTGLYSVKLSVTGADSTNTFVRTNYIHVIDTITKVQENSIKRVKIFPNPFKEKLNVSSLIPNESYSIIIYNLNGKEVIRININDNESINVNTIGLKPGIYVLSISSQYNSSNFKIIKK